MIKCRPIFDDKQYLLGDPVLPIIKALPAGILDNDYFWAKSFLLSYSLIPDTFKSYRREVERFCQWSWLVRKQSVLDMTHDDISSFLSFCRKPPDSWIGENQCRRFIRGQDPTGPARIPNPKWTPFVSRVGVSAFSLSNNSLQAIFSILSTFYRYLLDSEQVRFNPVAQIKQKTAFIATSGKREVRRLTSEQWTALFKAGEDLAVENPEKHERTRYLLALMYGLYPRISELVPSYRGYPVMGDFRKKDGQWWITLTGKRNKIRRVPVGDAIMDAVIRYRLSLGLPAEPERNESTPLLPALRGREGITSTRQVRGIIEECMVKAANTFKRAGKPDDAANLMAATAHWIRHTGISVDLENGRPIHHVRDDAGHADISTTDIYIDPEERERHETAANKKLY